MVAIVAGRRLCGVFSAALHESSGSLPELVDALLPSFGELSEAQIRGVRPSSAKPGRYTLGSKPPQSPSHFLLTGGLDGFGFFLTRHIHRPRLARAFSVGPVSQDSPRRWPNIPVTYPLAPSEDYRWMSRPRRNNESAARGAASGNDRRRGAGHDIGLPLLVISKSVCRGGRRWE